jgi:hypothetical protein
VRVAQGVKKKDALRQAKTGNSVVFDTRLSAWFRMLAIVTLVKT